MVISQVGLVTTVAPTPGDDIQTITGNSGGAVGPDPTGDIDFTGNANQGITVVGTPAAFHLQIQVDAEDQTIYVGKGGSNTNEGTMISGRLLTIGAAITAASALVPSTTNVIAIVIEDGGTYTENITVPSYVKIFAPNATLSGTIILQDNSAVRFYRHIIPNGTNGVSNSGTIIARAQFDIVTMGLTSNVISITAGLLYYRAQAVTIESGSFIGPLTNGTVYADVDALNIATLMGSVFNTNNAIQCHMRFNRVTDTGGQGTFIAQGGASTITVLANSIVVNTLIVQNAGTCGITANIVTGTQTLTGGEFYLNSSENGIDNVPSIICSGTVQADEFQTLNGNTTVTIDEDSIAISSVALPNPNLAINSQNSGKIVIQQGGGLQVEVGDIDLYTTQPGISPAISVTNLSGAANSGAVFAAVCTTGDPVYSAQVGAKVYAWGIDDSTAANDWVLADGGGLGTSNRLSINGTTGALTLNNAYSMPTADGSTGQVLQTNGAGVVSFGSPTGGGASFLARKSGTTANVTGNGTVYQIICDIETTDTAGSYNTATGFYTAASTGVYWFGAYVGLTNLTAAATSAIVSISNASTTFQISSPPTNIGATRSSGNISGLSISGILNMTAGNSAALSVQVDNVGADTVGVLGGLAPQTFFYGFRLS